MFVPLTNLKHLSIKAILLSAGLHILIFNSFIIVLPTLPRPHKPDIVFLGSILASSDVLIPTFSQQQKAKRLEKIEVREQKSLSYQPALEKPHRDKESRITEKPTLKTTISPDAAGETPDARKPVLEDVEIDLEIEPYKPLRLRTND